jgi:hypothetical protein
MIRNPLCYQNRTMTEKFETKNINRQVTILKYGGIGLIAISIIKVAFFNQFNFKELGESLDSVIWLLGGLFALYSSKSKGMKDRMNQFIEWDDKKVIYKLIGQDAPQEIEFNDIAEVSISLEKVSLTTKDDSSYILDITDFKNFEDRKRIKAKFESILV